MKRAFFTILFPIFIPLFLHGQMALRNSVESLADSEGMRTGVLGFCAVNVESGKEVFSWESDKSLIPASTWKAITTATALGILGPDYRYETVLEYDGEISAGGVLTGNLYIRGEGDPTLGSDEIQGSISLDELVQQWEQSVLKAGIKAIKGQVIADVSIFGTAANCPSWQWADLGNYYAGGAWGINIHENLYYLNFQQVSGLGKTPPVHSLDPEVPGLELINEVRTAAANTGDNAYIFGAPYQNTRIIRGTIPAGKMLFTIKGSLPNPPAFTAQLLSSRLASCGIDIEKGASVQYAKGSHPRHELHRIQSPSLKEIIIRTNHESVNLYAEALLRTIGQVRKEDGSLESSLDVLTDFWEEQGLQKMQGFLPEDGSGLSARNLISARQMASIMSLIAQNPESFPGFEASLPVAGKSGTMKYFLDGTAATGKVFAKSGSMNRVRAYTGYVSCRSGQKIAFSLLANNYSGSSAVIKRKMEQIVLEIYRL
jgi:D-alanyl-D-alanine carboxypeptidase/D-alanyl-D-alanine-endopeptidase (penicillin-binding protein 4)